MDWAFRELMDAEFGDLRLTERLVKLVEALSRAPEASVPEACGSAGAAKAAYRFWNNPKVSGAAILKPHVQRTAQRAAKEPVVLAVQDRTSLDFSSHRRTAGLGYLKKRHERGILLHQVLAVSPQGVPLGLLHQQFWTRPLEEFGKKKQRGRKVTARKETQAWLVGLRAARAALPDHPCIVVVGDRESDIYDLFAAPRDEHTHLLVRVRDWRRRVNHPAKQLGRAMRTVAPQATVSVEIPRADQKPGRQAVLTLRWTSLEILRPANHPDRTAPATLRLWFLLAEEESPPPGETPIRWLLASTLPIDTLDDASQTLLRYTYRWRLEQLHFVEKSGCCVEHLELETVERLERAIATYSLVAWQLLWLTYLARKAPELSCVEVLPGHSWQVLCLATPPQQLPDKPPTLREAVRRIAKLGGFLGRKGDGEPGVETLWRGWRRLVDLTTGYDLVHAAQPPPALSAICG